MGWNGKQISSRISKNGVNFSPLLRQWNRRFSNLQNQLYVNGRIYPASCECLPLALWGSTLSPHDTINQLVPRTGRTSGSQSTTDLDRLPAAQSPRNRD